MHHRITTFNIIVIACFKIIIKTDIFVIWTHQLDDIYCHDDAWCIINDYDDKVLNLLTDDNDAIKKLM